MTRILIIFIVYVGFAGNSVIAQYGPPPGSYGPPSHADGTMFQKLEMYGALGITHEIPQHDEDLFGHSIDVETGTLSFRVTDVHLPGNSNLEVAFRRSASSGDPRSKPHRVLGRYWQMDIPHIIYTVPKGHTGNPNRCTGNPFSSTNNNASGAGGMYLFTPNEGRRHISKVSQLSSFPSGLSVKKMSKDYWLVHCGINVQGGGGQGFWVSAPNGDKYKFDRMFRSDGVPLQPYSRASENLVFYPSEVRDVNGNWVRYDYNSVGPTRIYSNDGRRIDIGYDSTGESIRTVTANGRTWRYDGDNVNKITLPDGRYWTTSLYAMFYTHPGFDCSTAGTGRINGVVTVKHPDGVVAKYKLKAIRNANPTINQGVGYGKRCTGPGYPFSAWTYSLGVSERTHTLPDEEKRIWTYEYEEDPSQFKVPSNDTFLGKRTHVPKHTMIKRPIKRTVTDPEGNVTISHVYRGFDSLKGTITKVERFNAVNLITPIEIIEYEYKQNLTHYFPDYQLGPLIPFSFSVTNLQTKITTKRGNDSYITQNTYQTSLGSSSFGNGAPHTVKESSNVASGTRETVTTFSNSLRYKWILALPTRQTLNGKVFTDLAYDPKGRLKSTKRFGAPWATFTYHDTGYQAGNIASYKDALGRTTEFTSFKRGIPQTVTRADKKVIRRVVDNNGWVTRETNARRYYTSYTYDVMGRLTRIDKPSGWADTTISYSGLGSGIVKTVTNGSQRTTTSYNGMYEPTLVRNQALSGGGGNIYKKFDFDKLGRPVFESQASTSSYVIAGFTTRYDALGRVTQMRENVPPYATTNYTYLSQNRTRVTDPAGAHTVTAYQAYGAPATNEPKTITDPLGSVTSFTYNIYGQVTNLRQAGTQNGRNTSFVRKYYYDSRLRLCRKNSPEFGDEAMSYNDLDLIIMHSSGESRRSYCITPSSSKRTSYTYDVLNRPININYPGTTPDITKLYDENGNVEQVSRGSTVWTYSYNNIDMMRSEKLRIDGRTYATIYGYNPSGYLNSQSLPAGGGNINFDPDGFGRSTGLRKGSVHYVDNIAYHPTNVPSSATYGNGKRFSQTLDNRQLPYDIKVYGAGTQMHLRHRYDSRGNIKSIYNYAMSGQNRSFGYDANSRLVSASGPWGSGSFMYDSVGNMLNKRLGSRTVSLTYDSRNRLSRVADSDHRTRNFSYDTRGNVKNDGRNGFVYDWANQPYSISGNGLNEQHTYDGNLKRVKTVRDGKTSYSFYSSLTGNLTYLDEVTDNVKTHYLSGGGASIRLKNGVPEYMHLNHLGSAEVATSSSGSTLWRESYTPFGEKMFDPTANRNNVGYTGHVQDDKSGLTYMQARYYDPVIGRFYSNDPVGYTGEIDTFNRYSYVANNPYKYQDPNGESKRPIAPQVHPLVE